MNIVHIKRANIQFATNPPVNGPPNSSIDSEEYSAKNQQSFIRKKTTNKLEDSSGGESQQDSMLFGAGINQRNRERYNILEGIERHRIEEMKIKTNKIFK
jgi:hypothetical protein